MNNDLIAEEYLAVADLVFGQMPADIERWSALIADAIKAGNKVLVCGNGGSAADAQHFVAELVNRFLKERRPYAGLALTTDSSVITSIANDYSYDEVFSKQVEALGNAGDVFIGISTSGNANNVCLAAEAGRKQGLLTIAMTGGTGGKLAPLCDEVICISCTNAVPRIQEGHGLIIHLLCERIEEILEEKPET